jgi:monothiol glutaredoxin
VAAVHVADVLAHGSWLRARGNQGISANAHEAERESQGALIRQLSPPELLVLIERGTAFEFVDVRTDGERAIAKIEGSRLLDQAYHDELLLLSPDTPIVFQCHHGVRSQRAAEYFEQRGFRNLSNLAGGINAWSQLVDPSAPRY